VPDPASEGIPYIGDDGAVHAQREHLGAAYEYGQRTFRDRQYKLIEYCQVPANAPKPGTTPGTDAVQLFDLEADPWEMVNLADDPSYGEIRRTLETGLRQWQHDVGDELLKLGSL
jgi:arylsulfatase A-like enzyme